VVHPRVVQASYAFRGPSFACRSRRVEVCTAVDWVVAVRVPVGNLSDPERGKSVSAGRRQVQTERHTDELS
jgi:hypothetical protein